MNLRPIVRLPPFLLLASAVVVTAHRVTACSLLTIGWIERASPNWIGPRTWPQLISVVITAPKARISKKLSHIQRVSRRSSSALSFPLDLRFLGSVSQRT